MSVSDLESDLRRLGEVLAGLGRRLPLRDPITGTLDACALTAAQAHAVMWLGRDGPLPMGVLAQRLGVTETTLTGLADRLERAGYLERRRDTADRRTVHLHLTEQGAATARELSQQMSDKLRRLLGLLDDTDRTDLLRVLERLLARLDVAGSATAQRAALREHP